MENKTEYNNKKNFLNFLNQKTTKKNWKKHISKLFSIIKL